MASAAQITANRNNAQLSTGPQTPEGKLASSQNAVRHGYTSTKLNVPEAARAEFEKFRQDLLADIHPEGALEESLFERILLANWNLRRIIRRETELLDDTDPFTPAGPDQAAAFDRLARYRRDLERSASRALKELRSLQTERAVLLQLPARAADAICQSAPLAELTRITSNTDHFIKETERFRRGNTFFKDRAAASQDAHTKRVLPKVDYSKIPDPLSMFEKFSQR